jgi:hypothetical protein
MEAIQVRMNKVSNLCISVAMVAMMFVAIPSRSYGQLDCGANCQLGGTVGGNNDGLPVLSLPSGQAANTLAVGYLALSSNTSGIDNTATGASALESNTSGPHNTADGEVALVFNTTGGDNTAMGAGALFSNTTGAGNSAIGYGTLDGVTTGSGNTAIGNSACQTVTTASNVICIGQSVAGANTSNTTFVAGIFGTRIPGKGNPLVCIDKAGQLGTKGCAKTGTPVEQEEINQRQEEMIHTQAQQIAELQHRLSQLESFIAKK